MKTCIKRRVMILLMMLLVLSLGAGVNAGFRKMPNGKYRYYTSKKKYLKGKKSSKADSTARWTFKNIRYKGKVYTFCFDENGYVQTGWKKLYTSLKNGSTGWYYYYFDKNGRMYKNRTKDNRYLQGNGRMLTNAYGPGGMYYGADGRGQAYSGQEGFVVTKKGTKYRLSDGSFVAKSWKCIKDPATGKYYWYYFYSSGYMAKNKMVGNHYVDAEGHLVSGQG